MKKSILLLIVLLGLIGCQKKESKKIKIGITQIVEHQALDSARVGFEKALTESGLDVDIEFQNAQGEFANSQLIANSFVKDKKDLILGISTPSAQSLYNATKHIPILVTAVTDFESAGLVGDNITGTSDMAPVREQFEVAKQLLPNLKKIGIIYNTSEQNSLVLVEKAKIIAKDLGIEIVEVGISSINDMSMALDTILKKVDALYTPTDNLVVSATPLILEKANKKNIPVIACVEDQVKQGALVTVTIDYEKLGYQTGEMAVRILKGEDIKDIKVKTLEDTDLIINKESVEKYNVDLKNIDESKTIKII